MKPFEARSFVFLFVYMLTGCIDVYVPGDVDEVRGLLVVEGTITEGKSVIKLSKSVGLLDSFSSKDYITDADVFEGEYKKPF